MVYCSTRTLPINTRTLKSLNTHIKLQFTPIHKVIRYLLVHIVCVPLKCKLCNRDKRWTCATERGSRGRSWLRRQVAKDQNEQGCLVQLRWKGWLRSVAMIVLDGRKDIIQVGSMLTLMYMNSVQPPGFATETLIAQLDTVPIEQWFLNYGSHHEWISLL